MTLVMMKEMVMMVAMFLEITVMATRDDGSDVSDDDCNDTTVQSRDRSTVQLCKRVLPSVRWSFLRTSVRPMVSP